jgi:hypothetical protein
LGQDPYKRKKHVSSRVRHIDISDCLFSTTDISSSISLLRNWRNGTYPAYMMYWTGSYVLYYKCAKFHHSSTCNYTAHPNDQRGHKASGHSDRTLKSVVAESAARHNIRDSHCGARDGLNSDQFSQPYPAALAIRKIPVVENRVGGPHLQALAPIYVPASAFDARATAL